MSFEENKKLWDSIKNLNSAINVSGMSNRIPKLQEFLNRRFTKNLRILDLGIGPGILYNLVKDNVDKSRYIGADISNTMLKYCQENTKDEINLILLDSFRLPFFNDYFDVALCYSVFTHYPIYEVSPLLQEIMRVSKLAMISVIEGNSTDNSVDKFYTYDKDDFKKLCDSLNFKIMYKTEIDGEPQQLYEVIK